MFVGVIVLGGFLAVIISIVVGLAAAYKHQGSFLSKFCAFFLWVCLGAPAAVFLFFILVFTFSLIVIALKA